jgi:hypothetical protein
LQAARAANAQPTVSFLKLWQMIIRASSPL